MNVLLIGSGGREHALAWKLAQSKNMDKLYIAPGNPGTAQYGENVPIKATDIDKLVDFAKQKSVGLVIVGPEDPLAAGIVDLCENAGIKAFGPNAEAAKLEADKAFAKQLMRSSAISTAEARIFDRFDDALVSCIRCLLHRFGYVQQTFDESCCRKSRWTGKGKGRLRL